jgi:hypothetical protein
MAYDIPTRFHKVWSRHLREMLRIDNRHRFWNWKPYYDPSDHIISCYYSSFFLSFFLSFKMLVYCSRLLGKQILPKSEDFCILAAILHSKWPP